MSQCPMDRRRFLAAAGAGLAATSLGRTSAVWGSEKTAEDGYRGLKMGLASYSVRAFPLEECIAMTRELGVKYLKLKSMHLEFNTTPEERKAAAKKIADAGLVLYAGGVIYMENDEKDIRTKFEYARDAGMGLMTSSCPREALPLVEKMVQEYDIRVAIHNHGPGDKNGMYSALDVYRCVRDFDPRIGLCVDLGHTIRWGDREVDVVHAVKDRLYDVDIKDETMRSEKGSPVEVGRGVTDIPGFLKALLDIGYSSPVALEYEKDEKNPMPGMKESFAYIRGVLAAI